MNKQTAEPSESSPDRISSPVFHCGVYVDWLNLKANGARELNFDKFFDYIRQQGGFVRSANFYAPRAENSQRTFYDSVRNSGFRIVMVPEKQSGARTTVNCDVMLAVEMVTQGSRFDVVYLLSNDGDFIPAVKYCKLKASA